MAAVTHRSSTKSIATVQRKNPIAAPATRVRKKRRSFLRLVRLDMSRRNLSYAPNITSIVEPLAPGSTETAPDTAPAASREASSELLIPAIFSCGLWRMPRRRQAL